MDNDRNITKAFPLNVSELEEIERQFYFSKPICIVSGSMYVCHEHLCLNKALVSTRVKINEFCGH